MAAKPTNKNKPEASTPKPSNAVSNNHAIKNDFNKRFGEGTFFTFEDDHRADVFPIASGIPTFDFASGIGGIPSGRIIEIFGPESGGKTSLALMIVANFQKIARLPGPFFNKKAAFLDAEHALDPLHVKALGVDTSQETGMLINQPETGEKAFDLMDGMCSSGSFGIVVVDSAASLVPQAEFDNDNDYNPMGMQARMLSKGLRKLKGPASTSGTTFIFINQIREKPNSQGLPLTTTPGGRALKFYASLRIEVKSKKMVQAGVEVGLETVLKFVKNKVSSPFKEAEYDYYWQGGVDRVKNIMSVALSAGIIHRKGSYYFYGLDPNDSSQPFKDASGQELKWQGKEPLLQVLRDNPELYEYTMDIVLKKIPKESLFFGEDPDEELPDSELFKADSDEQENLFS